MFTDTGHQSSSAQRLPITGGATARPQVGPKVTHAATNLAHGLGHGPIGALVSAWPALALVGSFELLMMLIRAERRTIVSHQLAAPQDHAAPSAGEDAPSALADGSTLEQTVRVWHHEGRSQRAIARELNIDRRKVKRIIDQAA